MRSEIDRRLTSGLDSMGSQTAGADDSLVSDILTTEKKIWTMIWTVGTTRARLVFLLLTLDDYGPSEEAFSKYQ